MATGADIWVPLPYPGMAAGWVPAPALPPQYAPDGALYNEPNNYNAAPPVWDQTAPPQGVPPAWNQVAQPSYPAQPFNDGQCHFG